MKFICYCAPYKIKQKLHCLGKVTEVDKAFCEKHKFRNLFISLVLLLLNEQPSVSLAFPLVGWHKRVNSPHNEPLSEHGRKL